MPALSPRPPFADPRHQLGLAGESAAARCLEQQGFDVVARRFRVGRHELDLVARRSTLVVFAEVKTRGSTRMGPPEAAVGVRQRRVIARVAEVWVQRHGCAGDVYRFDLLAVRPVPDGWAVRWIRDAWRPDQL